MTLYDFAEETYNHLDEYGLQLNESESNLIKNYTFKELMDNENKCLNLIQSMFEFKSEAPIENKDRASHILITWLLGIGFSRHLKISDYRLGLERLFYSRLWLKSSILHDYGYFRNERKEEKLPLESIVKKYNLLTDTYDDPFKSLNNLSKNQEVSHLFTYTYDEVKNYYKYSQWYHKEYDKGGNEKNDHGIVGGCIAFRKYCEEVKKSAIDQNGVIMQIQKLACFITASHNIFKSCKIEKDKKYKEYQLYRLLSAEQPLVTEKNSILLLLSLVDTIECTKAFSKTKNPETYLIQRTTLEKVDVFSSKSSITVDFSNLYTFIVKERESNKYLLDALEDHIKGVKSLPSWTTWRTDKKGDYIIEIFPPKK